MKKQKGLIGNIQRAVWLDHISKNGLTSSKTISATIKQRITTMISKEQIIKDLEEGFWAMEKNKQQHDIEHTGCGCGKCDVAPVTTVTMSLEEAKAIYFYLSGKEAADTITF